MNCTKCGHPLDGGALFCKSCGYQHAANEQKARVNEAVASSQGTLLAQAHSVMFLVFAIAFSVMFVSQTVSMLQKGLWGILGGILPFIFMLIGTIGLWKSYTAKDNASLSGALRSASIFDAYQRVMYTISIVFASIGFAILLVLCLVGGEALSGLLEESSFAEGGIILAVIVLIIAAITITILSLYRAIFAHRRAYFLTLSKTAENGEYTAKKAPLFGSWFLGICTAISGLSSFGSAAMANMLGDILASSGEMGEVRSMVGDILLGSANGAIMAGISSLVLGAYYIVSALWMSSVHKAEVESHKAIEVESARLAEIEEATKTAVFEYENEKRKAEEEKSRALELERKAAEAEAKKSQAAMQEQQQMMMQMMMQQMMANGMNMPNVAHPEAPAAEAPAAEEAPVAEEAPATEEAPAAEAAE